MYLLLLACSGFLFPFLFEGIGRPWIEWIYCMYVCYAEVDRPVSQKEGRGQRCAARRFGSTRREVQGNSLRVDGAKAES